MVRLLKSSRISACGSVEGGIVFAMRVLLGLLVSLGALTEPIHERTYFPHDWKGRSMMINRRVSNSRFRSMVIRCWMKLCALDDLVWQGKVR